MAAGNGWLEAKWKNKAARQARQRQAWIRPKNKLTRPDKRWGRRVRTGRTGLTGKDLKEKEN